jgi:hypothetical protein
MTLIERALRAVQVSFKSVSNEWHFTLEAERVLRPCLPSHNIAVTEICHVALPVYALGVEQVRWNSVSNEGHITHEV